MHVILWFSIRPYHVVFFGIVMVIYGEGFQIMKQFFMSRLLGVVFCVFICCVILCIFQAYVIEQKGLFG